MVARTLAISSSPVLPRQTIQSKIVISTPPNHDLSSYGHLLVRRAIERDDWVSESIFNLAAGDQAHWTPEEWAPILTDLETCDDKLADWLPFYV